MITPDVNKIKLSEKRDDDEKLDSRKEIHREQHRLEKIEVSFFVFFFLLVVTDSYNFSQQPWNSAHLTIMIIV